MIVKTANQKLDVMKNIMLFVLMLFSVAGFGQGISAHANAGMINYVSSEEGALKAMNVMDVSYGISVQVVGDMWAFGQMGDEFSQVGLVTKCKKFRTDLSALILDGEVDGIAIGIGPSYDRGCFVSTVRFQFGHSQSRGATFGVGVLIEMGLCR